MNERIKELAKQAGLALIPNTKPISWFGLAADLERFAELIRADERDACAALLDELAKEVCNKNFIAVDQRQFCAKQIRARSDK